MKNRRIVLGVSGASGVILARRLAEALREADVEIHLVMTEAARLTWSLECEEPIEELYALADHVWDEKNMAASIASGSFPCDAMVVCPCSMKTLAGIVTGYTDNLLLRAADVALKEERKLILVPREMPFGKVHLRNLSAASDLGCSIVVPFLTFYAHQTTLDGQMDQVIGKILRLLGIDYDGYRIWEHED